MPCPRCTPIAAPREIRDPDELVDAIAMAQAAMRDGILDEVPPDDSMAGMIPFAELGPPGRWDDVLLYRFRCTGCGQGFALAAETYHGSGGSWEPER